MIIALGAFIVWLILVTAVVRGWRNRGRRQEAVVGAMPTAPSDLGEALRGPHTGLYLGSTLAPSWQNRIAVGDVGDRATATITGYAAGIEIARTGASTIWIPEESIVAVRTENGIAGKAMGRDGVLVVRWALPSGTQIDSGLRGDDRTTYAEWTQAYSEITEKAFRELELADENRTSTGKTDEKGNK
nr:transporter [Gordonia phthalatica]